MKKSASSITNRDGNASQRKRIRSSTPVREEDEVLDHGNDDLFTGSSFSQKTVKKFATENSKGKKLDDKENRAGCLTTTTSTASGSNISFSLPSKGATATKNNKTAHDKSNRLGELKEKKINAKQLVVNDPVISKENSSEKTFTQTSKKSRPSTTTTSSSFDRPAASHSKAVRSPLTSQENISSHKANSQRVNDLNLSGFDDTLSSTSLNASNSNKITSSIDASIEGSLEYRELKRMYLHERNQAEEWRKDYYVIKKQLAKVKETTIPRPTAEVLEWLQELLYLINNSVSFIGDGRDLKKIGEDLGLDETSLLTVVARTPQKSALKLFRLLYPTIGSRAKCVSISEMCQAHLHNVYYYVRNLHKNLNFSKDDMRKAIGTSIRSARRNLLKQQNYQRQRADAMHDQQDRDPDATDEGIERTVNGETTFNRTHMFDEAEDDNEDGSDEDIENEDNLLIDEESDDESEDEDGDKRMNILMNDEELDEDSE